VTIRFFSHWRDVPQGYWRWPNFKPSEVACQHCGELLVDEEAMDALQHHRGLLNGPLKINSAYRCPIHNAMVGGAPLSAHKFAKAFDKSLTHPPRKRVTMEETGYKAGFKGMGRYKTFSHQDTGRKRIWGS
jgi:uncharacterized protein YcbK (DUF882 family)|tara:strand:- start:461 stop:853 length:393 start_codon:yes stop_codon:yes gene_type:complete